VNVRGLPSYVWAFVIVVYIHKKTRGTDFFEEKLKGFSSMCLCFFSDSYTTYDSVSCGAAELLPYRTNYESQENSPTRGSETKGIIGI
jgi:hypothetical protein